VIPQSFIQDLLNRIDITEIIGRHVQLKKAGANFVGLCPFHNEKSPSFTVSPTKQFFHCFGCSAHGSAIGFLMEHTGLSYVEAIRDLAHSVGMSVPTSDPSPSNATPQAASQPLLQVMQEASNYYRQQLKTSALAIHYLKNRGLSGEIAAHFGLGYAPAGWQNLEQIFGPYQPNTATTHALLAAGLIIEKQTEQQSVRHYDRFRQRILFPIRNIKGQIIAFGGRILDTGEPKYLNSPETPLFSKSHELYGLFEARTAIREKKFILVTEGYMDVVTLAQFGFHNAVATLGTACTAHHIQKLLRQTDRLIFAFDGDTAGQRAARRAMETCLPYLSDSKRIEFLLLAEQHDPDSFLREKGAQAFTQAIAQAIPLSQFLLQSISEGLALSQPEGRAQLLYEAKPLLQAMPSNALRIQIMHSLAGLTKNTYQELETLCKLGPGTASPAPRYKVKRLPPTPLEKQLLRLLLRFPELVTELDTTARTTLTQGFRSEYSELLNNLLHYCDTYPANFAGLSEYLAPLPFMQLYVELQQEMMALEISLDAAKNELSDAIAKLEISLLKQEQNTLITRIQAGQANEAEYARYRTLTERIRNG
jgi:DNA primase